MYRSLHVRKSQDDAAERRKQRQADKLERDQADATKRYSSKAPPQSYERSEHVHSTARQHKVQLEGFCRVFSKNLLTGWGSDAERAAHVFASLAKKEFQSYDESPANRKALYLHRGLKPYGNVTKQRERYFGKLFSAELEGFESELTKVLKTATLAETSAPEKAASQMP